MTDPVLSVRSLSVDYTVGAGTFHALRDVSFDLFPGRVVGIVGETGCGKSTLAHAIPRLLAEPPARVLGGQVVYRGVDLMKVEKWRMPLVRGTGIGMIFQEPINSLNPAFRVYDQLSEAVRIRRARETGRVPMFRPGSEGFDYSTPPMPTATDSVARAFLPSLPTGVIPGSPARAKDMRAEVLRYLELVRINDPETILNLYPHELSGGMRQRIMIAMALSEKPGLLIADEPTSALDVTIQAQVLTLMKELMDEVATSILFISHDLGVIAETADDIGVMYAGHLVEFGPVEEVFHSPRHPYTKALLRSVPTRYKGDGPLPSLPGSVPNLSRPPPGCTFNPRCPLVRPVCRAEPSPPLSGPAGGGPGGHLSACWFADEVAGLP